jgi:F0F1-type ATP synthase assembly protein I
MLSQFAQVLHKCVDRGRTGSRAESCFLLASTGRPRYSWPAMTEPHNHGSRPNPLPDEERRAEKSGAGMAGVGLQFTITVVLCAFVGNWIDKKAGSGPWGVVAGGAIGFAAGLYALVKAAKREDRRASRSPNGDRKS